MLGITNAIFLAAAPVQVGVVVPPPVNAQPATSTTVAPSIPAAPQETPEAPAQPIPSPPVPAAPPSATAPAPAEDPLVSAARAQADIVVTADSNRGDPLRGANAVAFGAAQAVDDAVIGPVAMVYKNKVPTPVQRGIHNFLYNLREPIVFLNYMLQLKPGKAAETLGRFAINSTIGIAGVMDVAKKKPFYLPRRPNGFADTLGYWGVPNGPYMFLPIVGPTTVRDLFGGTIDRLVLPVAFGDTFTKPSYTVPAAILGALDHRAEFDDVLHILHDDVPDPYAASRDFYLQRRQAEIDQIKGKPINPMFRTFEDPRPKKRAKIAPAAPAPLSIPQQKPVAIPTPESVPAPVAPPQ